MTTLSILNVVGHAYVSRISIPVKKYENDTQTTGGESLQFIEYVWESIQINSNPLL